MALELAPQTETTPSIEVSPNVIGANGFCQDFARVCDLERAYISRKLQVQRHKLAPEYLASHLKPDGVKVIIDKIDNMLDSEQNNDVVYSYLENSERADFWQNPDMSHYIVNLARMGITGGLVTGIKDLKRGWIKDGDFKAYRVRATESNDRFVDLIDSEFGRSLDFKRSHLKVLIRAAYGPSQSGAFEKADGLERGLAVEIATKRYTEGYIKTAFEGDGVQRSLRYGTVNEDLRAGDLVYTVGSRTLLIDVKSGDKVAKREDSRHVDEQDIPSSRHSRIEQIDRDSYKIYQLHPATHRSINDDFEITEPAYKLAIQDAIQEFESLVALDS